MFWDKNLPNAKKAEKKMEKRVKEAESLVKANDALTDIAQKKREAWRYLCQRDMVQQAPHPYAAG